MARSGPQTAAVLTDFQTADAYGVAMRHSRRVRLLPAIGWALLATFDTIGYAARRAEVDRDLRIVELAKKQADEQQTLVATNERRVKKRTCVASRMPRWS
jgi:hypothetical protein